MLGDKLLYQVKDEGEVDGTLVRMYHTCRLVLALQCQSTLIFVVQQFGRENWFSGILAVEVVLSSF